MQSTTPASYRVTGATKACPPILEGRLLHWEEAMGWVIKSKDNPIKAKMMKISGAKLQGLRCIALSQPAAGKISDLLKRD